MGRSDCKRWPPRVGESWGKAVEDSVAGLSRVCLGEIMSSLAVPKEDMYAPMFLDVLVDQFDHGVLRD